MGRCREMLAGTVNMATTTVNGTWESIVNFLHKVSHSIMGSRCYSMKGDAMRVFTVRADSVNKCNFSREQNAFVLYK